MRQPRTLAAVLCTVFAVSACADQPVEPDLAPEASSFDSDLSSVDAELDNLGDEAPTKHLVVFKGKAPKNFEARVADLGGEVTLNHKLGIAVVLGLDEESASTLQSQVRATHVEEMATFELIEPAAVSEPVLASLNASPGASVNGVSSAEDPTQAALYADQWNMQQVNAEAAWASGRLGSEDVTVAILDTGIDYLLPDFDGRVDLSRSASFEPLDDLYAALYYPDRHVSTDLHYHGTNVATQVASNAFAYAGVTSQTTLMSVKVCSFLGGCSGVIEGILHAIDNGADVINMSLGGRFEKAFNPGLVSVYNTLMNYAKQNGVTIVVAAGNDATDLNRQDNVPIYDEAGNVVDLVHVPSLFATYCDATHVICVSATRTADESSSYTNYGRSAIDVAAPGGDSGDWVYSLCPQTSLLYFCEDGLYTLGVAGTSQAAPHVAGLAALAVEDVGRNVARVRAYVRNSADAIGGGNAAFYGKGRINVGNAVGAN